jgi:hypothetical protein
MSLLPGPRLGGLVVALGLGLASTGVANAQQQQLQPSSGAGVITGEVDKCVGGAESPAANINVGVVGGNLNQGQTDDTGDFILALPPGQYTIQATSPDGTTASRPYVPVEANSSLDIGVLDLAGGCGGADVTAPPAPAPGAQAQPTAQATEAPTVPPTEVPATPTVVPTPPPPTATAVPAPDESAPSDQPTDQPSDDTAPPDTSGASG